MEAMDARRLCLYELLKPTLGEEVAKELVLQLPAEPGALATKADLDALKAQILDRMDARSAEVNGQIGQLEATLTRRMIGIMGAWTVLLASTAAWASAILG